MKPLFPEMKNLVLYYFKVKAIFSSKLNVHYLIFSFLGKEVSFVIKKRHEICDLQ